MTNPAEITESNTTALIPFIQARESFSGLQYYFSRYKLRRFNTTRQQLYALRRWSAWCMDESNQSFLARDQHGKPCSFPFLPEGIAAFIRHLAGTDADLADHVVPFSKRSMPLSDDKANATQKFLSYSSVKQYVTLLNMIQKGARMPGYPPFMDNYLVQDELNELRIEQARREVTEAQALPLMLEDLQALVAMHSTSRNLKDVRNLLILWVGFETLMRNDELARIKLKDMSYSLQDRQYSIVMRRSKTNKDFAPVYYVLSKSCSACLNHMFRLAEVGPSPDPCSELYLFRPLMPPAGDRFCEDRSYHLYSLNAQRVNGHTVRTSPGSENRSLKSLLSTTFGVEADSLPGMRDVDEEVDGMLSTRAFRDGIRYMWSTLKDTEFQKDNGRYQTWTGHSARVGGAIELLRQGYSETQIMQMGNWKSMSMVLRYTRNMTGKDKAMAKVASKFFDGDLK